MADRGGSSASRPQHWTEFVIQTPGYDIPHITESASMDISRASYGRERNSTDAFMMLLPLLVVLSTLLLTLLLFLICVLIVRRQRGISLRDHEGPIDVSREDALDGDGGFEGVEQRWLESVSEEIRRGYRQAKRTCLSLL